MITHTMKFVNLKLSLVDGRAPKKEGSLSEVETELKAKGYVAQSRNGNNKNMEIVFVKPETDADRLDLAMKDHDWTFTYSDSPGSQRQGMAQVEAIRLIVRKMGDEGFQMVKRYIEKSYPNGGTFKPEEYR